MSVAKLPWTRGEKATLRLLWPTTSVRQIGRILGRTHSSIRNMAMQLGLKRWRPWRLSDEAILRSEYPKLGAARTSILLGRTTASVTRRAFVLGVRRERAGASQVPA